MFSCWVVKTKPTAVKYVKKYVHFEETSLMSVKENCITLGGYVILQLSKTIRIPKPKSAPVQFILIKKLQNYSWMWKSKDKFNICDLLKHFYG